MLKRTQARPRGQVNTFLNRQLIPNLTQVGQGDFTSGHSSSSSSSIPDTTPANLAILDFFPATASVFRSKQQPPTTYHRTTPTSNTAKLSSTILQRTGLTFADGVKSSPPSTSKPPTPPSARPPGSSGSVRRNPSEGAIGEEDEIAPPVVQSAQRKMSFPTGAGKEKVKQRRRRSSSLMYQEPPESLEQQSDQAILPNLNAQWVNAKGMLMHSLLHSRGQRGIVVHTMA